MIFDTVPVEPLQTNCYLIGDENEGVCALVDPGGSPRRVLSMLEKSGLELEMILLTHGHYDHTGAIGDVLEQHPDVPVYIHSADILPEDYESQVAQARDRLAALEAEERSAGARREELSRELREAKYAARELVQERSYMLKGAPGQRFIRGGDQLALGGLTIRVLHTPGHSAGSVCFLVEDQLLCGDTLFAGACGRWDLPGGDGGAIMESLAKLARLQGNFRVCPGHGPLSTLDAERQGNPYMRQAMEQ